jgi:hypothetical protein
MNRKELSGLAADLTRSNPDQYLSIWQAFILRMKALANARAWRARTEEVYAKADYTVASLQSYQCVVEKLTNVQDAEQAASFMELLATLPADVQHKLLESEIARQRQKLEWEQVRQKRREVAQPQTLIHQGILPPELLEGGNGQSDAAPLPVVEQDFTSAELEGIALRGLVRVGVLPPTEQDHAMTEWLGELRDRMPVHSVAEVERYIQQFREKMG